MGTIGFLKIGPNSHSLIPGVVRATIDPRHPIGDAMSDACRDAVQTVVKVQEIIISVLSEDGVSQNSTISIRLEKCAAGAQVPQEAVLDYDHCLSKARKGTAA